jgi:hypothetical protein
MEADNSSQVFKRGRVLLAFDEDVQPQAKKDYLLTPTKVIEPLHRYKGIIELEEFGIKMPCRDRLTGAVRLVVIGYGDVEQLLYGFDEHYTRLGTRSNGTWWKPIRFTVPEGKYGFRYVYLIINYASGNCDNKEWLMTFKFLMGFE